MISKENLEVMARHRRIGDYDEIARIVRERNVQTGKASHIESLVKNICCGLSSAHPEVEKVIVEFYAKRIEEDNEQDASTTRYFAEAARRGRERFASAFAELEMAAA